MSRLKQRQHRAQQHAEKTHREAEKAREAGLSPYTAAEMDAYDSERQDDSAVGTDD